MRLEPCLQISNEIVATWHEIRLLRAGGTKPSTRFFSVEEIARELLDFLQQEKDTWRSLRLEPYEVAYKKSNPTVGRVVETQKKVRLCAIEKYWGGSFQELIHIPKKDMIILPKKIKEMIDQIRKFRKNNISGLLPVRIAGFT